MHDLARSTIKVPDVLAITGHFEPDFGSGLPPYSLPSQQYVQIFLGSMPMASIMPCSDW